LVKLLRMLLQYEHKKRIRCVRVKDLENGTLQEFRVGYTADIGIAKGGKVL
jgi:hypothetical protein